MKLRSFIDWFRDDLAADAPRTDWRSFLSGCIDVLTLLMALAAGASLVARYGFFLSPPLQGLAGRVSRLVLYGFLVQAGAKLLLARSRRAFLREHVVDMIAILVLLLLLLFPDQIGETLQGWNPILTPDALANIYVAITQALVVAAFIPAGLRASRRAMTIAIQPSLLIVMSFAVLILAGAGALMLPRATIAGRISFIDALFTAASAGCVTGLTVLDTGTSFTSLGRLVILLLIQVGGLGIMTFTTFFAAMVSRRGSLKEYATLQALFGEQTIGRIKGVVVQIILMTLGFELAGAALLYFFTLGIPFTSGYDHLFFSVFHSVSAFCNAGFSLLPGSLADPFLRSRTGVLCVIMALIVCGGLGFAVLRNVAQSLLSRRHGDGHRRLTLYSRIVLATTAVLILAGAAVFALLESSNTLAGHDGRFMALHSLFQSITARTAGFNSLDVGSLRAPTLFLLMILMWIGASPGSTGGGIKTTALALLVMDTFSVIRGRERVECGRVRVEPGSISRAHATALVSLLCVAAGFFTLAMCEPQPLVSLLFETFSAAGTVGLSTGITPHLSVTGKVVMVVLMFIGRVGFLTIAMALTPRARMARVDYAAQSIPIL